MNVDNHGIRKAAILVDCLDQPTADRLLDEMEPHQARLVRQAMVDLDEVDPAEQRRVIDEFLRVGPMVPDKEPPGIELDGPLAAELPTPAPLPELDEPDPIEPAGEPPFRSLRDAEADKLSRILAAERPQMIALVLSHLPPEQAGSVLARLDAPLQVEVIRRLVDLEETEPEILREVERALESRVSEHVRIERRRVVGLSAVAGILEATDGPSGMQILDNLAAHDRQLADKLGPEPLEFDELARLDDASLAAVLASVDRQLLILALVGAPPQFVQRLSALLAEPEADTIRHELTHPGPTRLDDVAEARRRIAELARRMAAGGRIAWPRRGQPTSPRTETLQPAA